MGIFLLFVMLFAFSACSKIWDESDNLTPKSETILSTQVTLTISAAASLIDALNEIKSAYSNEADDVNITYNFASSGSLQQQIENGAEVDLFISAAQKQMDSLKKNGFVEEQSIKNIIGNELVLIVPINSDLSVNFEQLNQDKVKKLGMGEPKSVPAGQYAQQVFNNLNIIEKLKTKVVYAKNVRTVLTWVEREEVDAGIVYKTDAKSSKKVKIIAKAPDGSYNPILYPASIINSSKNKLAAKNFLNFLSSDKSKSIFEELGFKLLEK